MKQRGIFKRGNIYWINKKIVLLLLVFFLFGFKNSSDALENSDIPKNCSDWYFNYCLKQYPYHYCDYIAGPYLNCLNSCRNAWKPRSCREACRCDLSPISPRWKYFGENNLGAFFYDFKSVTLAWSPPQERVFSVWWKIVYTEKGKEKVRKIGEEYKNADSVFYVSEINCTTKEIRDVEGYIYPSYPPYSPLSESRGGGGDWDSIAPGSIMENLFNEVCSKKNK